MDGVMAIIISACPSATWKVADFVIFISLVFGCHAQSSCLQNPDVTCETCSAGPVYDISTNCSTCVEPRLDPLTGCTECMERETQCFTGKFTFSALFHSYYNPQHLCGECWEFGTVCCNTLDRLVNCGRNCHFRLVFLVQPYNATALDVELPRGLPEFELDIISKFEQGPNAFPVTNRSNPYTVELETWTERLQFYIVLYDFNGVTRKRSATDRFLINLVLGGVPNSITRQTYFGIYNISQLDLSFNIRCSANYYGPQCSNFCSDGGVYTCDPMGNRICANPSCDPSTGCLECPTTTSTTTSHGFPGSSLTLIGGVIGAILAVILILILPTILLFIICRKRKMKCETGKCQIVTSKPRTSKDNDKSAVELVECLAYEKVSTLKPAVETKECVAYEHASTLKRTSQELLPATTELADYDVIYNYITN